MKITVLSDFHGVLPVIKEPTDLVLICGDISPFDIQHLKEQMVYWLHNNFKTWIEELPCKKVIMVPGNHDFYFLSRKTRKSRDEFLSIYDDKLICLWNESYTYEFEEKKYEIFGTPYCKIFGNWAFMVTNDKLKEKFSLIPPKIDILLSHDPPYGLGDKMLLPKYDDPGNIGNQELRCRLDEFDADELPRYCFFGHIHTGNHEVNKYFNMQYANVSLMDEYCDILYYKPLTLEID